MSFYWLPSIADAVRGQCFVQLSSVVHHVRFDAKPFERPKVIIKLCHNLHNKLLAVLSLKHILKKQPRWSKGFPNKSGQSNSQIEPWTLALDNHHQCHAALRTRCGRVIQRTQGCDLMQCGRHAHETAALHQEGCGHQFSWSQAPVFRPTVEAGTEIML